MINAPENNKIFLFSSFIVMVNTLSRPKLILFLLILVLIIGVYFIFYYGQGPLYQLFNNLSLVPRPERFTELYFNNSSLLPTATAKNKPVSFSFTIHNEEGASFVYPYIVYFEDPQGNKVDLSSGVVTLDDNATTTIPVSHTFTQSNEQGTVVVDLTSLDQQIDFLLSNPNE